MTDNAHSTIKETDGRFACTACEYEWGAGMDESEIPNICPCQETRTRAPQGWFEYSPLRQQWRSLTVSGELAYHADAREAELHLRHSLPSGNRRSPRP
jgi:hypothetical protein